MVVALPQIGRRHILLRTGYRLEEHIRRIKDNTRATNLKTDRNSKIAQ